MLQLKTGFSFYQIYHYKPFDNFVTATLVLENVVLNGFMGCPLNGFIEVPVAPE